jgi:hypothetical protein
MSLSKSTDRQSRNRRAPISLNHKLDHKLLGYAAAASAAGVGMMALVQPSQAEIVYTPAHQIVAKGKYFNLDFNHDGVTDLTLRNVYSVCFETTQGRRRPECSEFTDQFLLAYGTAPNGVMAGVSFASALPVGKRVGQGNKFADRVDLEQCFTSKGNFQTSNGPWLNVKNLYLGVTFTIDGATHYGWVRLSVTTNKKTCDAQVLVTGYAYDDTPNKAIPTGKISGNDVVGTVERSGATLGALALGSLGIDSPGIEAWRREKESSN